VRPARWKPALGEKGHKMTINPARFERDDDGFVSWRDTHPDGFVLNSEPNPTARYLPLHKASCRTLNGKPANGKRWTFNYIKVCSDSAADLLAWAATEAKGVPQQCGLCFRTQGRR
jgi:hypothetical protein